MTTPIPPIAPTFSAASIASKVASGPSLNAIVGSSASVLSQPQSSVNPASVAPFKDTLSHSLEPESSKPTEEVVLDALVVLKIIKHSRDCFPNACTGQLLGLDVRRTLEVTNCVPSPSKGTDEDDTQDDFQMDMLRCLREVNVDSNTVGWYSSAMLGSFMHQMTVDVQAEHQRSLGVGIVIIYDPIRSVQGNLSLRALRLTDAFMKLNATKRFTADEIISHKLSYSNMFQELPIQIRNSFLLSSLVNTLQPRNDDHLDVLFHPYLERNMLHLLDSAEEYTIELNRYLTWQRAQTRDKQKIDAAVEDKKKELIDRGENPRRIEEETKALTAQMKAKLPPEPQRLELLLITNQIAQYCDQIKNLAGPSISMLYAMGALMKKELPMRNPTSPISPTSP